MVETTTYDDGRVYTGQRSGKGKIEGKGLMTWPNGDRYEGNFDRGHMSGKGKFVGANGVSYDGNWLNDQYNGQGKYISAEGEVMEGIWRAGKLQQ